MTQSSRLSMLLLAGLIAMPSPEATPLTVPETVGVRLFAIEQPREIRVTTGGGQTTVVGNRPNIYFRSDGPATIDRPGSPPVHLEYPIEVKSGKTALLIINEL